jgi:4-hydroxybenzoate polyprenyltransferase/phosphoserine phosphatase
MASPLTATDLRASVPICVDLDGTLVCTDTMWECLIAAWRKNFWLLLLLPYWLVRGRAYLKAEAEKHANLDVRSLPYDADLVNWLAEQRDRGRTVVLATGSSRTVANKIAEHLGIFSQVIASTRSRNLSGQGKLKALQEHFQGRGFEYIGDSRADVPIWSYLGRAHVRGASERFCEQLEQEGIEVVSQGRQRAASLEAVVRQLRIHQWAKNLLIFIPLFTSHKFTHGTLLLRSVLAFVAFGFVASSFYVFNDLLDVRADRQHPNKRFRPIACGQLSMNQAAVLLLITLGIGLVLASRVSLAFLGVTLAYLVGTATYSIYAKRLVLVDAFVLGLLYTVRVLAGGVATGIPISSWTLGYTSFLFLSLALMKRYSEMSQRASDVKGATLPGRAYELQDLSIIGNIGIASGMMSALLMALYLRSPEVEVLYRRPALLLPLCIIHVYWISRAWLLTNRQLMHDDPILFALKDRVTHKLLVIAAIIAYFAT